MKKHIYAVPILTGIACAAMDQYFSRKYGLNPNSALASLDGVALGLCGVLIMNAKGIVKKEYKEITGIQPTEHYPMSTIKETIDLYKKIRRKDYT